MHDVDRTQFEAYETEEEYGEYEEEGEEFLGALVGPATNIIGGLLGGHELESPFSEMETLEYANELLEVQSEDELEALPRRPRQAGWQRHRLVRALGYGTRADRHGEERREAGAS